MTIENIAGLADSSTELPEAPLTALAGPNGSGKSTFLVCLLAPWLNNIAKPDDATRQSRVSVDLGLNSFERRELALFAQELGYGDEPPPGRISYGIVRQPRAGVRVDVAYYALQRAIQDVRFLERVPSLDVLYLPAERRLGRRDGGSLNLEALTAEKSVERLRSNRSDAFSDAGRLDEHEFESWATALCVADFLPGSSLAAGRAEAVRWSDLQEAVDVLLSPKSILPVDVDHPTMLRIGLPNGRSHALSDLSSGERQSLIILGSLFRAGASRTVTIIDEPDLHLHPQLASPLLAVLRQLRVSQLIVASHSPLVLDSIPPSALLELRVGTAPQVLTTEQERLDAYRYAGFRVSEVSQASHIVLTEGDFDVQLLKAADPSFERAAIRAVGGRAEVLRLVADLSRFDLPVSGVVDRDLVAPSPAAAIAGRITVWPAADVEGSLLADDCVLQAIIDRGLAKPGYADVAVLRSTVDELATAHADNAVAEFAASFLRDRLSHTFPSPRGVEPLERLREAWSAMAAGVDADRLFEEAVAYGKERVADAGAILDAVRGKWIINRFAETATVIPNGSNLLLAIARDDAVRRIVAPAVPPHHLDDAVAAPPGTLSGRTVGPSSASVSTPRFERLERQRVVVARLGGPTEGFEARLMAQIRESRQTFSDAIALREWKPLVRYAVVNPDVMEADVGFVTDRDITVPEGLAQLVNRTGSDGDPIDRVQAAAAT